jgi:TolA-binding protein
MLKPLLPKRWKKFRDNTNYQPMSRLLEKVSRLKHSHLHSSLSSSRQEHSLPLSASSLSTNNSSSSSSSGTTHLHATPTTTTTATTLLFQLAQKQKEVEQLQHQCTTAQRKHASTTKLLELEKENLATQLSTAHRQLGGMFQTTPHTLLLVAPVRLLPFV